jgi:hypothetical protein
MADKIMLYRLLTLIAGLALAAALWWLVTILNIDLNAVQLDAKPHWPAVIIIHCGAILSILLFGTALVRFGRRGFARQ